MASEVSSFQKECSNSLSDSHSFQNSPSQNHPHHPSNNPSHNASSCYSPYDKYPSDSFCDNKFQTLCLHCRILGHWANACTSSSPSKPSQTFIVEWNGRTTSSSPSSRTNQYASCSTYKDPATLAAIPSTANILAPSAPIQSMEHLLAPITDLLQILYKVVTPYIPEAWRQALLDVGIVQNYPNLIHDLEFSSPISNLPSIDFILFLKTSLPLSSIPTILQTWLQKKCWQATWIALFRLKKLILFMVGIFTHVLLARCKTWLVDLHMICHFSKKTCLVVLWTVGLIQMFFQLVGSLPVGL